VTYLLDTNVVSEVRKPHGNRSVRDWIAEVPNESTYLSVLVVGEIRTGIELLRHRDPRQTAVLERWLINLRAEFASRILPITADIAEEWARMNVPNPVPIIDGLIAATAKVHDLTLVTRDIGQFEQRGVRVLNPFDNPISN
jgi:predicted nucleic acid-binding protein